MTPSPDDRPIAQDAYAALAARYAALIDSKPHNAYYEQPTTRALLPDLRDKDALDAGCGTGLYSAWALDDGARVVGVDASPEMLAFAHQRTGGRATLHQADLRAPMPFLADESFDLVMSSLVMHYIGDWSTPLAEFNRVLRPGGHFVFSVGHPQTDYRLFENARYFEVERVGWWWKGFGGEPVYVPFFRRSLGSITGSLWDAGFVIEQMVEPMPTEEFRQADPDDYEELLREPGFLCIRARKDRALS